MDSLFTSNPEVAYLGNPSLVGIYLIDELLKRSCKIQIFAEDQQTWQSGALLLKDNFGFTFRTGKKDFSRVFDYILVSSSLPKVLGTAELKPLNFEKLILDATKLLSPHGKIIVVLPLINYSKNNFEEQKILDKYKARLPLRVIYIGDVFGRGMDFYDNRPISNVLLESAKNNKFIIPDELTLLYPLKVEELAKEILKTFFSYWREHEVRVITGVINYGNLFLLLKKYNSNLEYLLDSSSKRNELLTNLPISVGKNVEENTFEEIIPWIQKKLPVKFTQKSKNISKRRLKMALAIFGFVIFFVSSPFLLLLFSWLTKNSQTAKQAKSMFVKWTNIPVVGQRFTPFVEASGLVEGLAKISARSKNIFNLSDSLLSGILDKRDYKVDEISEKLYLELDSLYNETSFLESDIAAVPFAQFLVDDIPEFARIRNYINSAKEIIKAAPDLISGEKPKIYMVLLQDNNNLRPTGGLITRFALLTFETGKLINTQVYETKNSDALLKGFVKPPDAVKKYLQASNWSMLDSNWDADFIESAKNAEWFLEKEMDIKVDGVIGVDGTVEKLSKTDFKDSRVLVTLLLNLALEKHLQFYAHDISVQNMFSASGFNGSAAPPSCGASCNVFWVGLNEANIGPDNISTLISRFSRFEIAIENKRVDYALAVHFKNSTDSEYKSYLRVMSSNKSIYDSIKIVEPQKTIFIDPEITGDFSKVEAGTYFELEPGEEKTIVFSWSEEGVALPTPGSRAQIYFRKQAGTQGDRVEIVVKPLKGEIFTDPRFELTSEGTYRYNTELKRDFSAFINN